MTTDKSIRTAVGIDYSYDGVLSRQIGALGRPDDRVFGMSTSGNSGNFIEAFLVATLQGLKTIALVARGGGKVKGRTDVENIAQSDTTSRIQEARGFIGHAMREAWNTHWAWSTTRPNC